MDRRAARHAPPTFLEALGFEPGGLEGPLPGFLGLRILDSFLARPYASRDWIERLELSQSNQGAYQMFRSDAL